jgi:hypothetical protein
LVHHQPVSPATSHMACWPPEHGVLNLVAWQKSVSNGIVY